MTFLKLISSIVQNDRQVNEKCIPGVASRGENVLENRRKQIVHAVIALGYPAEPYKHCAGRRQVTPRYFRVSGQKVERP